MLFVLIFKDGKGTLLEFVLKTYCQIYENEVEIGCPTRFRLPEPSNMRHASQVKTCSQITLNAWEQELKNVLKKQKSQGEILIIKVRTLFKISLFSLNKTI